MATKTFGEQNPPTLIDTITSDLHKLVGVEFPCIVTVTEGKLTHFSYDTEWKEGGTEPVEHTNPRTKEVTIEYKENYKVKKLTDAQIKKIDEHIATLL